MTKRVKRTLGFGIPAVCVLLAVACVLLVWRNGRVTKTRFRADYTDAGYQAAKAAGRYTPVALRHPVGGAELSIEEIYADKRSVLIRYTVTGGDKPLSGDSSSYRLADKCRIEIDGAVYDKAEQAQEATGSENGRYEAALLLSADDPEGFSFSRSARLVLTVDGLPDQPEPVKLETTFEVYEAASEDTDVSRKIDGRTVRLKAIEKGAATLTFRFDKAADEGLESISLRSGNQTFQPVQILYSESLVQFPALKEGASYTVQVNGQTLYDGVY